jgi:MFS family permease
MLYTIGSIVGGAWTGMVWSRLGARRAYTLGAGVFALGTVCCALAPDIGSLIAARGVPGWAGGLVSGSGMALITSLFDPRLRTRIIAISQGTFTACHLSGPIVGGMFAAMQWWRGSGVNHANRALPSACDQTFCFWVPIGMPEAITTLSAVLANPSCSATVTLRSTKSEM